MLHDCICKHVQFIKSAGGFLNSELPFLASFGVVMPHGLLLMVLTPSGTSAEKKSR